MLLAGSGLLDDKSATPHWAYVDHFRLFYPKVKFEVGRVLVPVGGDSRIVTCGGMAAWEETRRLILAIFMLMSFVVRQFRKGPQIMRENWCVGTVVNLTI